MSTADIALTEQRFLLHGVPWRTYLELRDQPENEHLHMTYGDGELEMMAPSKSHAQYASLVDRLLQVWTLEHNIDIQSCRDMTCRRDDLQRGFEPDNCYYVANEALVRQKTELDLTVDPPPDLAVEIDLGRSGRQKLATYAAFGVPEVWWFDGRGLQVFVLAGNAVAGPYSESRVSTVFAGLPPAEIERVLARLGTVSETTLVRSFRDWVRAQG